MTTKTYTTEQPEWAVLGMASYDELQARLADTTDERVRVLLEEEWSARYELVEATRRLMEQARMEAEAMTRLADRLYERGLDTSVNSLGEQQGGHQVDAHCGRVAALQERWGHVKRELEKAQTEA